MISQIYHYMYWLSKTWYLLLNYEAPYTWTHDGKTQAASLDLRKIEKIFSRILVHAGVRFSSGLVGG